MKHIERHLKDKGFKIYFDKAEAKRKIAQGLLRDQIAKAGLTIEEFLKLYR